MNNNFFPALAVMVGYVIGVGMFGLPFLASKAGLLSFFVLLFILALTQYFVHLIYASVILETKGFHRMPGYAKIYLGPWGGRIVFYTKIISNLGALLAYIIISGIFLHQLLGPIFGGSEFFYASLIFFIEAVIVFFGIGAIAKVELLMSAFLILVIALVSAKSFNLIEVSNYQLVDWKLFFIPYGAMLFAFDGCGSLPLIAKMTKKNKNIMRKVVRWGTFIPVVVIAVFTLVIVGVSGTSTTPDALAGLGGLLNNEILSLALIFGIIAMFTSFLGVSEAVRETLMWDYKIEKHVAWAIAMFVPYLFYVLGLKNFIGIISFAGAIAGGITATALVFIFIILNKNKSHKLSLFKYRPNMIIVSLLIVMFISGIIYELLSLGL